MWMQGLQAILLALTPYKRWDAARGTAGTSLASEPWLTGFAVVALALSVILLCWEYTRRRRTESNLRDNITDLTITIFKLRQEKDELAASNKELQQEMAELSRRQVVALENMKSQFTARK
jgi:hypothetical protein